MTENITVQCGGCSTDIEITSEQFRTNPIAPCGACGEGADLIHARRHGDDAYTEPVSLDNDADHTILCAWPYRPCAALCGYAAEPTSPKFASALAERLWTLSLDSNQDADLGDAQTFGWFALFAYDRAILVVNSQGLVSCSTHWDSADARVIWRSVELAYERFELEQLIFNLDTSECDALFLIIDTAKHLGNVPTREELEDHIREHAECSERNAWALDV